ncbi:RNA-binding protein Cwf29 [Coemansia spiralis]|uniref:RNA-binding protein Cwf29 n=2 Tax=Coemansia TaxID=4863 RepID=A0A9W8KVV4_9FUNG|nr:RNA-binding protein Cwf29 [Coemansia umbellata]KAJ2675047.1 RNA-binding protein Cwf29 [Coemansia spiralis]
MNVVQEIRRINENEQRLGSAASWHDEYKDSAYIFVGGLPYDLTEGDVVCVFSQYGEIVNINLVRDKETGRSKGFVFIQYEDQRSTILAVDNLNGLNLLGRVLRVDHVKSYRQPKQGEDAEPVAERVMNAVPQPISADPDAAATAEDKEQGAEADDEELMKRAGIDPEDPMAKYYLDKYKRRLRKESKRRSEERRKEKGNRDNKRRSKKSSDRGEQRDRSHSPSRKRRSRHKHRRSRSPSKQR